MPARKQQNVAGDVANALDDAVGPDANLIRCFSSRTTVPKQVPIGALLVNLLCTTSFILTVIPFQQITVSLHIASEAGRLRPDMVVRLPSGRQVVVDAKAPLEAYLDALDIVDEPARRSRLDNQTPQDE